MNKGICPKTGKHRHASRGAADAHVRAIRKGREDEGTDDLSSFLCVGYRACGGWHVGNKAEVKVIPVLPKMQRSGGLKYKKEKV